MSVDIFWVPTPISTHRHVVLKVWLSGPVLPQQIMSNWLESFRGMMIFAPQHAFSDGHQIYSMESRSKLSNVVTNA